MSSNLKLNSLFYYTRKLPEYHLPTWYVHVYVSLSSKPVSPLISRKGSIQLNCEITSFGIKLIKYLRHSHLWKTEGGIPVWKFYAIYNTAAFPSPIPAKPYHIHSLYTNMGGIPPTPTHHPHSLLRRSPKRISSLMHRGDVRDLSSAASISFIPVFVFY